MFKGTSNKRLQRKEIENKLYEHFATPGEYRVLSKETGQPPDQTAGFTDDGTVKFLLCVMKNCGFRCSTAYVQGALSTV